MEQYFCSAHDKGLKCSYLETFISVIKCFHRSIEGIAHVDQLVDFLLVNLRRVCISGFKHVLIYSTVTFR